MIPHSKIKSRFKKRFGRSITNSQINAIWNDWVENEVISSLLRGGEVKIDSYNSIEVVGSAVWKDQKFVNRLIRGTYITPHLNQRRKDIKYGIVYKNSLAKKKLYFDACKSLREKVHHSLCTTNTYYSIQ